MPVATTMNYHSRARRSSSSPSFSLPGIMAILLSIGAISTTTGAFVVPTDVVTHVQKSFLPRRSPTSDHYSPMKLPTALCNNKNDDDTTNADLLEKARRLREEASLMEDDLRASAKPSSKSPSSAANTLAGPIENTQLEQSTWTLSYRFSSQPAPKESDNTSDDEKSPTKYYSGKLNLLLKDDGYSEQIGTTENTNKESDIEIVKIWGWDRETSNEDNLDYLLFSMDVKFPPSDPASSNQMDRYYFQARIEQDTTNNNKAGSIALKEGTITVKKDVTEKTGGMWGLFNVAGILTEFRYCGDFVAKASQ
jgi:hypothetical protein